MFQHLSIHREDYKDMGTERRQMRGIRLENQHDQKQNLTDKYQRSLPLWGTLLIFLAGQVLLGTAAYLTQSSFLRKQTAVIHRQEKLEHFQRLATAEPARPDHYTTLGLAYFDLGRYSEALTQLRLAIELDNAFLPAYLAAGQVYAAAGQKEDALGIFKAAKKLFPKDFRAYLCAGIILRELGRYAESAQELEKARALVPTGSDIYLQLGLTYEAWGEMNAAKDAYQRAVALNPQNKVARKALTRLR